MLAAAVSGLLAPAVPPIARVLWSTIGSPEQRSKYHGLEQFITELSYMLGSLLAGLLIAFFSGGLACIVVGALYAIGALLMSLSATRPVRMETLRGSYPQFLRRLLPLAAMFVLGGLGGGSVELAIPAFAIDRGEEILVGVILFVWGAGSVVGGVVLAGRIRNAQLVRWLIIGSFGLSLTIVPAALAQSSMALMLIIFLHGLLVVPLWGSAFALSEALMGSARRSQMFALLYLASTLGTSIGTAISGLLVTVLSPAASFLFGAVMYASLGVGLILRRRRILGRLQAPLSQ